MLDPSVVTYGPITGLGAAYLVVCWVDGCAVRVDPEDEVGLCGEHLAALRA